MDDQKEKYLQFPSNNRIYTNKIMVYRGTRINLKQKTGLLSDNYNNCNLNNTRSKGTSLNKTVRHIQLKRYLSNSCKNGVETHEVINTTDGKTEKPATNTGIAITDHPKISYKDIYQLENLKLGLKRIKNSVIPGVDNILKKDITEKQLKVLQKSLIKQSYQAKPSRRVTIKKPNGGNRQLGIACTNDKIIQSTLRILLEPILEIGKEKAFDSHQIAKLSYRTIITYQAQLIARVVVLDQKLPRYEVAIPLNHNLKNILMNT